MKLKINTKKFTPKLIIVKALKTENKEENLESSKRKDSLHTEQ